MRIALLTLLFLLLSGCSGYEVRDSSVYWTYWDEGMGSGETELDVDLETFEILDNDNYAKDKLRVFYKGRVIEGADAKTFKTISKRFKIFKIIVNDNFSIKFFQFFEVFNKLEYSVIFYPKKTCVSNAV